MTEPNQPKPPSPIRWTIRRDLPQILQIEQDCFGEDAFLEDEIREVLKQRNAIGMVFEAGGEIRGHMIYELAKDAIHLVQIAVSPEHQGAGVGHTMVARLKEKLSAQRRSHIITAVAEECLETQLWFQRQGFRAVGIEYHDDATLYVMRFDRVPDPPECNQYHPRNRIADYMAGGSHG